MWGFDLWFGLVWFLVSWITKILTFVSRGAFYREEGGELVFACFGEFFLRGSAGE